MNLSFRKSEGAELLAARIHGSGVRHVYEHGKAELKLTAATSCALPRDKTQSSDGIGNWLNITFHGVQRLPLHRKFRELACADSSAS